MNYPDIRYFIENQLKEAERNPDTPESGSALLLLADYLLEQIEKQPDVFTGYSGRELRKVFLRCGGMARRIGSFADQYGEPVAQEAAKSLTAIQNNTKKLNDLEKQCKSAEQHETDLQTQEKQIAEANARIKKENAALLAQENKLKKIKEESENLQKRISECKQIQADLTDEKMEKMRAELQKIEPEAEERRSVYQELEAKLKTAREDVENAQKNLEEIDAQIKKALAETKQLETDKIPAAEQELNAVRAGKAVKEEELSRLFSLLAEAGAEDEELEALIKENDRITERLIFDGLLTDAPDSLEHLRQEVRSLQKQAEEIMEQYNRILGDSIKTAGQCYQKLLERQEPSYKG